MITHSFHFSFFSFPHSLTKIKINFKKYKKKKELQKEIDNQNDSFSNLSHNSERILESFKKQSEKDNLKQQLNEINVRWSLLRKKSLEIR